MNIALEAYNQQKQPDFKEYFKDGKDETGKKIPAQKAKGRFLIAKYLIEKYNCIAINYGANRAIYTYSEGIYIENTDFIKTEIQTLLDDLNNIGTTCEILEQIRNMKTVKRDKFEDIDRNLINLDNGVFNLKTRERYKHDPKYYFFTKLPIKYDEEATWDNIWTVLTDLLQPKDIDILQEFFGFCLYRYYFIKKSLILTGEKHTGKTTILNILSTLIGKENLSGVSLQDLSLNRFAMSDLYNKYANIYDELSAEDINNTGKFKMITGNSPIMGEIKHGGRFPFRNYAKLIFACNKIPAVNDIADDAYFDRWIIINCTKTIAKDKRDPFLLDNLLDEKEISGLFNFALQGLARLLETKDFSFEMNSKEIKQEMLKHSNPLASFVYNRLVDVSGLGDDNYILVNKLFDEYTKYCHENEMMAESDDYFYKNIYKFAPYIRSGRKLISGDDRKQCYFNVKLSILTKEV